ncbi:MAG: redoxin domain-containing protein [Candidatus Dormibacteraeota bacterium]|nr:redoxin domain-containing protein [Candidatus Dormibacteraeota bacterium]
MADNAQAKDHSRSPRGRLWLLALIAVTVLAIGALTLGVVLQQREAAQGTVVVTAGGRQATTLEPTGIELHGGSGWQSLGETARSTIGGTQAPTQLLQRQVPAGRYDEIMLGRREFPISFSVGQGVVSPVLIQVQGGRPSSVYAGQDQVSLGEQELSGKLPQVPAFDLVNQDGRAFTNASIAGRTVILAAFETGSREAGPLYTGLLFQLRKHLPRGVMLVEVSVDPWHDTPTALRAYAGRTGTRWTLATGSPTALAAFWRPLGVQLTSGDLASSTLTVIDGHGYVRATYQGVPEVGALPAHLRSALNAQGLAELRNGDGWGQAQVLTAAANAQGLVDQAPSGGRPAKAFSGPDLRGGGALSLGQFRGAPVVINFFASYCAPCRAELPMLQQETGKAGVKLLLVDERDSTPPALALLGQTAVTAPAISDPNGAIGGLYTVQALPDTYYVFGDGTLEGSTLGELSRSELSLNLQALRQGPA